MFRIDVDSPIFNPNLEGLDDLEKEKAIKNAKRLKYLASLTTSAILLFFFFCSLRVGYKGYNTLTRVSAIVTKVDALTTVIANESVTLASGAKAYLLELAAYSTFFIQLSVVVEFLLVVWLTTLVVINTNTILNYFSTDNVAISYSRRPGVRNDRGY